MSQNDVQDAQAQSDHPIEIVSVAADTQADVAPVVRQRVRQLAETELKSDSDQVVYGGFRKMQEILGLKVDTEDNFERHKEIARIYRVMLQQKLDPVDITIVLSQPNALAAIHNNQGGIYSLSNMGNRPTFALIGTHGVYAKDRQGILKFASDAALINQGLKSLYSLSPFDRLELETKKLGKRENVDYWCKQMNFPNCPQVRVVIVPAPDGAARSRNDQFQAYSNGTMWMEITEDLVPKRHESTVEFYPRYHVTAMNPEVSNVTRNIMVTQDPANPVISLEAYKRWQDYASGYTLCNGTPDGQMARYKKVLAVAEAQQTAKVITNLKQWLVETEAPRYTPPDFIQDFNKFQNLTGFNNRLLRYWNELTDEIIADLDPGDWTQLKKDRVRATVTAPFWVPNPVADSGIATSTTKRNRDLPGDTIYCVGDQLVNVLTTAAEKDIAEGTDIHLAKMMETTAIFWIGKFKNKREIVTVENHTGKTRNYVNFSVFSQLLPFLFNSFVVRTMHGMEHDEPWPISYVGIGDEDGMPNMMQNRYMSKFNPTTGRLSKFIKSLVTNLNPGAYYQYYYSDNLYIGQFMKDTGQWVSCSLDGVKMEASHQQEHWEAYLTIYLEHAGVDPDTAIGRVFSAIFYRMTRDCQAVWGKCLVPFKALPSGFAGTTEVNSMLMRQVAIASEALLTVPRLFLQRSDDELMVKISTIPRVVPLISYVEDYLREHGKNYTFFEVARTILKCEGPVDMLRTYTDVEPDCGLIGILSKAFGVTLTNEATVEPLKDISDPLIPYTRLDMLGFNAVLTKIQGTDALAVVACLREESLIKAVLFDKTMSKSVAQEELDHGGFAREIIDMGKLISLWLMGGWDNRSMGLGAVLLALNSKITRKIEINEQTQQEIDSVCALMIDPDPLAGTTTQIVSSAKMTLQAMYKLQLEPKLVEQFDIKSGTVFGQVHPDFIDVDDVPNTQPTDKNQEPVVQERVQKLKQTDLQQFIDAINFQKDIKVLGVTIDVTTTLIEQTVTINKAKRNMNELLEIFSTLVLDGTYDGPEKQVNMKFYKFCMTYSNTPERAREHVITATAQSENINYFYALLLQLAGTNHLGHLSYVIAKASTASMMPITPYSITLEQYVTSISQACHNSLYRNVLYSGPIRKKQSLGDYKGSAEQITKDWNAFRKQFRSMGEVYEQGKKAVLPRVIKSHEEFYKFVAAKKSMPRTNATDIFGSKIPERVNGFIPMDDFISDTSKFVLYNTPVYAVENGVLIRYPLAISRPTYQKLRTVEFAKRCKVPMKYLEVPKIKQTLKEALARNSATILINLTGDTTLLNNPVADFVRGWPGQGFRNEMVKMFEKFEGDKSRRQPWNEIQRAFKSQYPAISFPRVQDPARLVKDVNAFNVNDKNNGPKFQRIMGAMMFGIPASTVPDSFTEFYAACRDTCQKLVPSAVPPLQSWLVQHLGVPHSEADDISSPIGGLLMEACAGCLTPGSFSIRLNPADVGVPDRYMEFQSVSSEFINLMTKLRLTARSESHVKQYVSDSKKTITSDITHYLKRTGDPQVMLILRELVRNMYVSRQTAGMERVKIFGFLEQGERTSSYQTPRHATEKEFFDEVQRELDAGGEVLGETIYNLVKHDLIAGKNVYDSPTSIVDGYSPPPDEVFIARGLTTKSWNDQLKQLSGQASADPVKFATQLRYFLSQFIYLNQTQTILKLVVNIMNAGCFNVAAKDLTERSLQMFNYPVEYWRVCEYLAHGAWDMPIPDASGNTEARRFQFSFMARLMPTGSLYEWYTVRAKSLTGYPALPEEPESRSTQNIYMNVLMARLFAAPQAEQTSYLVDLLKSQKSTLFSLDYGEVAQEFNGGAVNDDGKTHQVPLSRFQFGRREKEQPQKKPP